MQENKQRAFHLWKEKVFTKGRIKKFIKEKSIKTATSGTVKLFLRHGFIQNIPKGTTVGMFSHIFFVLFENIKEATKIFRKEITFKHGLENIGQHSLSLLGGLLSIGLGGTLGSIIGLMLPILGNWSIALGGILGSAIGYAIGSKLGHLFFFPIKKICTLTLAWIKNWSNYDRKK